jgi:hypothetical protein
MIPKFHGRYVTRLYKFAIGLMPCQISDNKCLESVTAMWGKFLSLEAAEQTVLEEAKRIIDNRSK